MDQNANACLIRSQASTANWVSEGDSVRGQTRSFLSRELCLWRPLQRGNAPRSR